MKTLSAVESFTGGLFAKCITDTPGASKFFKGSLVSYSNEVKEKLGVDTSGGVYNKKTALAMAAKGKEFFDTDICVSFTGVAGLKDSDGVKSGMVFIAINDQGFELLFNGTRDEVRQQSVDFVWKKIKHNFEK